MIFHPSRGVPAYSFNGAALPANGTAGDSVGIQRGSGEGPRDVSWFTKYGTAPTTIQVRIERSFDGATWYNVDSSSQPLGEMKTIRGETAAFLRAVCVSSSGGSTLTVGFQV